MVKMIIITKSSFTFLSLQYLSLLLKDNGFSHSKDESRFGSESVSMPLETVDLWSRFWSFKRLLFLPFLEERTSNSEFQTSTAQSTASRRSSVDELTDQWQLISVQFNARKVAIDSVIKRSTCVIAIQQRCCCFLHALRCDVSLMMCTSDRPKEKSYERQASFPWAVANSANSRSNQRLISAVTRNVSGRLFSVRIPE